MYKTNYMHLKESSLDVHRTKKYLNFVFQLKLQMNVKCFNTHVNHRTGIDAEMYHDFSSVGVSILQLEISTL